MSSNSADKNSMSYAVGDDVRVTMKRSFGVSIILIIPRQVPHDQRLVTATREKHVGVLEAGCERCHPKILLAAFAWLLGDQ